MHSLMTKDSTVKPTEPSAKSSSTPKVGLLATLRACPRLAGSGAPASVRRLSLAVIPTILAVLSLAGFASPALAAVGPPGWGVPPVYPPKVVVHSTRASIYVTLFVEGLPTKWKAEYAPAETDGEAPPEGSPAWTISNSGDAPGSAQGKAAIAPPEAGHVRREQDAWLRQLAPGTSYYARFIAENADSVHPAVDTIPFKTLPVAPPEVDKSLDGGGDEGLTSLEGEGELTDTSFAFSAILDTNGAEATYSFEYAPAEAGGARPAETSSSWKVFTSGGTGTVAVAVEHAKVEAQLAGLAPDTTYYVRLKAKNAKGEITQTKYYAGEESEASSFTTPTAKPAVGVPVARNVTADSAYLTGDVLPHGLETRWRFEYAEGSVLGPWSVVSGPGAEGAVSQAQAEALPYNDSTVVGVRFAPLTASRTYYVRMFAESAAGEGINDVGEPVSSEEHGILSFETSGAPSATTFATHALHGESLRLLGAVNPNSLATSAEQLITLEGTPTGGTFTLTFKGETTAPIVYDALAEGPGSVRTALGGLSSMAEAPNVIGPAGGPYTVFFGGSDGGVGQPLIEGSGLGLVPSGGGVGVQSTQQGGVAYDTHYHFEYVTQGQFESEGWAQAASTPEVDLGSGDSSEILGVDLPSLKAGEAYRYRVVAGNTAPGTGPVDGAEQSLTVPAPPAVEDTGAACPNEALRTGLSARLPDCRAYEQLTPVDKEGAQEPFNYRVNYGAAALLVGEDGQSAAFETGTVDWGRGPGAGQSPYLFSRLGDQGWSLSAGAPQPQTGISKVEPQVYSADLMQVAFQSQYITSQAGQSPDVGYGVGPVGGPYAMVASVPRGDVAFGGEANGWVASSADFSKLVFATQDRTLIGEEPTGTKSGSDLYEYTAAGGLSQLNVNGEGVTIGTCGATLAHGFEEGSQSHRDSGPHSLSGDGSRVFFEAVPTGSCPEAKHLYMRVDGTETVDLGVYRFLAASETGSEVLLEGTGGEVLLYDTAAATATQLLTTHTTFSIGEGDLHVSSVGSHLTALYFASREPLTSEAPQASEHAEDIYRYDLQGRSLRFVVQATSGSRGLIQSVSPDGRYAYLNPGVVAGVPGGAAAVGGGKVPTPGEELQLLPTVQVYRYDSAENVIECVSCASSSDPEPKLPAFLNGVAGLPLINGGLPNYKAISANGDYAFFTTPSALVPQDIDQEIPIEINGDTGEYVDIFGTTSPSSDVYEWRKDGISGCTQLQGCLALITSGRGGYLNLLLGMSPYVNGKGETVEGGNVFIYTRSQLLPGDQDTSGDVYDARIDGGFAPSPPRPTECEADACSTPPGAPSDATPSSLTFNGSGNLPPAASAPKAPVKKTAKKKTKAKKKKRKQRQGQRARSKRRAKGSSRIVGRRAN
jgi:hypothetical protein